MARKLTIMLALALALLGFIETALAGQDCPPPFPGAVAQELEIEGRNVTLFAAAFYERPGGPPERGRGARWVPGSSRHLCSVSTFMALSSSEDEGGGIEGRGEGEEGGEAGAHWGGRGKQGDGSEDNDGGDGGGGREAPGDDDLGPADVSDCVPLYTWAATHNGHWIIPQRELPSAPLLVLGSCAVTVGVRREWRAKLH